MKSPSFYAYLNACYHMRVLGYKLTCCISNTITMTIEVDTSTTLMATNSVW